VLADEGLGHRVDGVVGPGDQVDGGGLRRGRQGRHVLVGDDQRVDAGERITGEELIGSHLRVLQLGGVQRLQSGGGQVDVDHRDVGEEGASHLELGVDQHDVDPVAWLDLAADGRHRHSLDGDEAVRRLQALDVVDQLGGDGDV